MTGSHRTKVIACATVMEEIRPLLREGIQTQTLDFGLHSKPEALRKILQDAVNASEGLADTVVLGYGLCSLAVVGLRSRTCQLVVPRVDDCIGLFLGSQQAYREQSRRHPGTYYLTKGWIEAGDSPFHQQAELAKRHGHQRARRMAALSLNNYTRVAFIRTGEGGLGGYRAWAKRAGVEFGLRYEELEGSSRLIRKLVHGPWDDEILVVCPGREIRFEDFLPEGERNGEAVG